MIGNAYPRTCRRYRLTGMCHLIVVALTLACAYTTVRAEPEEQTEDPIVATRTMLRSYFKEVNATKRKRLGRKIEKHMLEHAQPDITNEKVPASVAAAEMSATESLITILPTLELWSTADDSPSKQSEGNESGVRQHSIKTAANTISVHYRLPDSYDPQKAHPLLVIFSNYDPEPDAIKRRLAAFPATEPAWIVAWWRVSNGVDHGKNWLHAGADGPDVLRELSKTVHINRDRVYVVTENDDGWRMLTGARDLFAGAIALAPWMDLPYPNEFLPLMAHNLHGLPIILFDTRLETQAPFLDVLYLSLVEAGAMVRRINLQPDDHPIRALGRHRQQLEWVVSQTRKRLTRSDHLFRFPSEGRHGDVACHTMTGETWEREQLSIRPTSPNERRAFHTSVLRDLHGAVSFDKEGQHLTITASRCSRAVIRWTPDEVRDGQTWSINCNGKKRKNATPKPDLRYMLEQAYQSWDFQRLHAAETTFSINE